MKINKNIYFLTGDLGYSTLEQIEKDFPKRFLNIGVAEQNMIGIAAGLALSGKKVYVYSIIPFLIMRCFEQIRNDICYHDLDVTLLGIGAGLSYGILSSTHFALEDIAIIRSLPNMNIFSPADEIEAILGVKFYSSYKHPLYIRIGKKEEPKIYNKPYRFAFNKNNIIMKGKDITIFSSGPIINEVIKASELLAKEKNISVSVVNIHTLKPINKDSIIRFCQGKKTVFTVEEHGVIGGLGSIVTETVSQFAPGVRVIRIGMNDQTIKITGTQSYLREVFGLDTVGIYKKILQFLKI